MKKVWKKQVLLCLLAGVMILSTACQNSEKSETVGDIDLSSYPIKTDVSLSYFLPLRSTLAGTIENFSETPFAQQWQEKTGVKMEYIHSAVGQEMEMLSLLVSSGELPDIIQSIWVSYAGGVASALDDNVIIDIGKYKEYAPAYFKKLEANKDWDKASKTDDGRYYGFQAIEGDSALRSTSGPILRADWLEELGLDVPETIDEWETVLTAFRDKKGAKAPFSTALTNTDLYHMFETTSTFYIDGDKFRYGAFEPEYKRALTTLNNWFKKGLLDKNIVSVDSKTLDSQILTGQTGAFLDSGGNMGRYLQAAPNEKFDLVAAKYPTYEKGAKNIAAAPSVAASGNYVTAISGQCKYPELAAKMLDYLYTEEGELFANFGIEGETYTMKDGKPTYTELITNNPDGLSMKEALGWYVYAGTKGPYECSKDYIYQFYGLPQQRNCLDVWQDNFKEREKHSVVPVTLAVEDSQEAADILAELNTHKSTMRAKFITGVEPMENFDAYVEKAKTMGLDRLLEIYNEALKRYNNR